MLLEERFKLDEKLVLCEKFVLKETLSGVDKSKANSLNTSLTSIDNILLDLAFNDKSVFRVLKKEYETNYKKFIADINASYAKQTTAIEYLKTLKTSILNNYKIDSEIVKKINNTIENKAIIPKSFFEELVNELFKPAYESLNKSAETALTLENISDRIKELQSTASDEKVALQEITDVFKGGKLTSVISAITRADEPKNTINFKDFITACESIQQNFANFKSNTANIATFIDYGKVDLTVNLIDNWSEAFKKAAIADANSNNANDSNIKAVWDKYFKQEWPEIDRSWFIKIQLAFLDEVNKFGYTPARNNFLIFIKYMLKNSKTFKAKIEENPSKYDEIHLAVSKNFLSLKSLNPITSKLKTASIIFNDDLYLHRPSVISNYIKWQSIAVNLFNKYVIENSNADVDRSVKPHCYNDITKFITDLFCVNGEIDGDKNSNIAIINSPLKNINEIPTILQNVFGSENVANISAIAADVEKKAAKDITTETKSAFLNSVKNNLSTLTTSEAILDLRKLIAIFIDNISISDLEKDKLYDKYSAYDIKNVLSNSAEGKTKTQIISTYFTNYDIESVKDNLQLSTKILTDLRSQIDVLKKEQGNKK